MCEGLIERSMPSMTWCCARRSLPAAIKLIVTLAAMLALVSCRRERMVEFDLGDAATLVAPAGVIEPDEWTVHAWDVPAFEWPDPGVRVRFATMLHVDDGDRIYDPPLAVRLPLPSDADRSAVAALHFDGARQAWGLLPHAVRDDGSIEVLVSSFSCVTAVAVEARDQPVSELEFAGITAPTELVPAAAGGPYDSVTRRAFEAFLQGEARCPEEPTGAALDVVASTDPPAPSTPGGAPALVSDADSGEALVVAPMHEGDACQHANCGMGSCYVHAGLARCECGPGTVERGGRCVSMCDGVDCGPHGSCSASSGEPACVCEQGYATTLRRLTCTPVDPCVGVECGSHQACIVGWRGPECRCIDGYHSGPAGCTNTRFCIDEDSDGYGEGVDCGGPDCDDDDPEVHDRCDWGRPVIHSAVARLEGTRDDLRIYRITAQVTSPDGRNAIDEVTVDLSPLGRGAAVQLLDNGSIGDRARYDQHYEALIMIDASVSGAYQLRVRAVEDDGDTRSRTLPIVLPSPDTAYAMIEQGVVFAIPHDCHPQTLTRGASAAFSAVAIACGPSPDADLPEWLTPSPHEVLLFDRSTGALLARHEPPPDLMIHDFCASEPETQFMGPAVRAIVVAEAPQMARGGSGYTVSSVNEDGARDSLGTFTVWGGGGTERGVHCTGRGADVWRAPADFTGLRLLGETCAVELECPRGAQCLAGRCVPSSWEQRGSGYIEGFGLRPTTGAWRYDAEARRVEFSRDDCGRTTTCAVDPPCPAPWVFCRETRCTCDGSEAHPDGRCVVECG